MCSGATTQGTVTVTELNCIVFVAVEVFVSSPVPVFFSISIHTCFEFCAETANRDPILLANRLHSAHCCSLRRIFFLQEDTF